MAARRSIPLFVLLAALAVSGCGSGSPAHTQRVAPDGKRIFLSAGCVGCHTLKDAGSSGTVGPDLDNARPDVTLVKLQVTNGGGRMPSFRGKLKPVEIEAVARYVARVAGR
ncbi:MAG: quinohemoprotein ethanol dehydrogenase [Gaiellaceae bacterium]|nr:quinohemoprotein ethanol dehydrogenase [Gaiellaceae bacterium]